MVVAATRLSTKQGREGVAMSRLNEDARVLLQGYPQEPITETAWARFWQAGDPEWRGDVCGCPDDHCIGEHHGADEPCGCIRALIADYEAASAEAAKLWSRHQAADPGAVEDGERWVRQRCDNGLTGWAFDIAVDDEAGIAITTEGDPSWRLLWSAGSADEW